MREVIRNILAELDITLGLAGFTSIAELSTEVAPSSLTLGRQARRGCRPRPYSVPMGPRPRRRATLAAAL